MTVFKLTEAEVQEELDWTDDPLAKQLTPGELKELYDRIRVRLEENAELEYMCREYLDEIYNRRHA